MVKLIKLQDDTYTRLKSLGKKDDTYDELVTKLLDYYNGDKRNE